MLRYTQCHSTKWHPLSDPSNFPISDNNCMKILFTHHLVFMCKVSLCYLPSSCPTFWRGGVQTWKVQYHILTCCTSQMPSFIGVSLKSPVHKIIIENILILDFFPTETRTWSQKGPMWYLLRKWSYLPGHLLVQSHSHQ